MKGEILKKKLPAHVLMEKTNNVRCCAETKCSKTEGVLGKISFAFSGNKTRTMLRN